MQWDSKSVFVYSELSRYTSARIKESLIIFLGTLIFNKIMFLGMFGAGNLDAGGSAAVAGGVVLIVSFVELKKFTL